MLCRESWPLNSSRNVGLLRESLELGIKQAIRADARFPTEELIARETLFVCTFIPIRITTTATRSLILSASKLSLPGQSSSTAVYGDSGAGGSSSSQFSERGAAAVMGKRMRGMRPSELGSQVRYPPSA